MKTLLAAVSLTVLALSPVALAAPEVDQNQGSWTDLYPDATGLQTNHPEHRGIRHDPFGRLVTISDDAMWESLPSGGGTMGRFGQLVTTPITPASFDAWGQLHLRFTAASFADLEVRFLGLDGQVFGPFPLSPSADPAWTATADLSGLDPEQVPGGRVLVAMVESFPDGQQGPGAGGVRPALSRLRVTWSPRALVRVGLHAASSVCANEPLDVEVRVTTSLVDTTGLRVWVPLPTPPADLFGRTYPLQVRSIGGNGVFTDTPIHLGDVTIPANAVFWDLGSQSAGSTFALKFAVAPPAGTLNGTTYPLEAATFASNADPASSHQIALVTQSAPNPSVIKRPAGTYRIANTDYAIGGQTLSYSLSVANFRTGGGTCGEAYHQAVLIDDVSDLLDPATGDFGPVFDGDPMSAFTISHGGQFTATELEVDGVTVPAGSIYWQLGTLEVRQQRTLSFSVALKDSPPLPEGHEIRNTARVRSGHRAATGEGSASVTVGIPNTPTPRYAKGDRIRGSGSVSANSNDNSGSFIGYGEPVTFLLHAANSGASQLAEVVMVDKVPAHTTFVSAFLPASARGQVLYNLGGADNAADMPPDLDVPTGVFGPSWSPTPPADPAEVRWVAFTVPRLASSYFPTPADPLDPDSPLLPTSVTAELTVVSDEASDACPALTINNRGLFRTYGYVGVGESALTPITGIQGFVIDDEPVRVQPTLPGFQQLRVTAAPSTRHGAGPITYRISLPNRQSGGVETGTALDVEVVIQMPRLSLNGTLRALSFVGIHAPGGTVVDDQLPDRLVVLYPSIAPLATRTIDVTVNVPKGFVPGQSASLSAFATGQDAICGAISASASASSRVDGDPWLVVGKRAALGVAARGSPIDYTLSVTNLGDAVSRDTWVVDQVPPFTTAVSAAPVPSGGQVWFSDRAAPPLPESVRADAPRWSNALVRQHFVQGVDDGEGRIVPPAELGVPVWVAFLVDDATLLEPQLPSAGLTQVSWRALVDMDTPIGTVILNEAAIFSRELDAAISDTATTLISDDPSLEVSRSCPGAVGAGEPFTYVIEWVNNSTNEDYGVQFIETLPPFIDFVSATHTWNAASVDDFGAVSVAPVWDPAARTVTWAVSAAIDPSGETPINSFQGGTFEVTVVAAPSTPSGTFADVGGVALATDASGELGLTLASGCRVLVENPDLFARLNINQASPVAGDTVAYTLTISNEKANRALDTAIVLTLPEGVTLAPQPVTVTTPGWSLGAPSIGTTGDGRQVLTWSTALGNALTLSGQPAGFMPGYSGDVNITVRATLAPTIAPETTLTAAISVATSTVEDPDYPNEDTATAVTPLPDPWLVKSGPSFAMPGASVSYRLTYGNASRQAAGGVFLVDRLWDAPPGDGDADVTLLGVVASHGEQVFYHGGSLLEAAPPSFDPADPAAGGWRSTVAGGPVHWIGLYRPALAGESGPFPVFIDVVLSAPDTGREPLAGATVINTATILFTDPEARDEDPDNNTSTVETGTPGIDIAASARCEPQGSWPGGVPGRPAAVELELRNLGVVTAYGLRLDWTPPDWFLDAAPDGLEATVRSAAGAELDAVDADGGPLGGLLAWTPVEGGFVLGGADPDQGGWYRRVGIPGGARVTLRLEGRIAEALLDGAAISQTLTVTTDYRFDFDEATGEFEENLANNVASCGATVYRADPMVTKTASGAGDASAPFERGDRIAYTLAYNNIGQAPAEGVVIEDALPEGAHFVVGSFDDLPVGAEVRYDDGSGTFGYAPVGGAGSADPFVRAFRVIWGEALPAPAGATFSMEDGRDFERGTFNGTVITPDGLRIGLDPDSELDSGSFLTPVIPTDPDTTVLEWGRILVDTRLLGEGAAAAFSVIDPRDGSVIAEGLQPDPSGLIEVSIDAQAYPQIQLRVELEGGEAGCAADDDGVTPLAMASRYQPQPNVELMSCSGGTFVGEVLGPEPSDRGQLLWSVDPEGEVTATRLHENNWTEGVRYYGAVDPDTLIGYDHDNDGHRLHVLSRVDGEWVPLSPIEPVGVDPQDLVGAWPWIDSDYPVVPLHRNSSPTGGPVGVLGAYHRVGGQWQYTALTPLMEAADPGLSRCDPFASLETGFVLRCDGWWGNVPAIFLPRSGTDATLEILPLPDGYETGGAWGAMGEFPVVRDASLFAFVPEPDWAGVRDPIIWEWQDTHWEVSEAAVPESLSNVRLWRFTPGGDIGGVASDLESSGWEVPIVVTRQGEGWAVSRAPLPDGFTWHQQAVQGELLGVDLLGSLILRFAAQGVPEVDHVNYALYRGPGGQWLTSLLPAAGADAPWPGGATVPSPFARGVSTGLHPWGTQVVNEPNFNHQEAPVMWVPTVEADGTRTYHPEPVLGSLSHAMGGGGHGPPVSFAEMLYGYYHQRHVRTPCSADFLSGTFQDWTSGSAVTRTRLALARSQAMDEGEALWLEHLPMPADVPSVSSGFIEGGANGAWWGRDTDAWGRMGPFIARPDPIEGLVAHRLELPFANPHMAFVAWVSPDHEHVLGAIEGHGWSSEPYRHVAWRWDPERGRYMMSVLSGAGHPDGLGNFGSLGFGFSTEASHPAPFGFARTRIGAVGSSRDALDNPVEGFWAHTPNQAQPFTWLAASLEDHAEWDPSVYVVHQGVDHIVAQYQASEPSGTGQYALTIVERDDASASGLRLTALPIPDLGGNVEWVHFSDGGERGRTIAGRLQVSGQNHGMLWARGPGGVWQAIPVPAEGVLAPGEWLEARWTSRRVFGPQQLPLVFGFPMSGGDVWRPVYQPSAAGYVPAAFAPDPMGLGRYFQPYPLQMMPGSGSDSYRLLEPVFREAFLEGFVIGEWMHADGTWQPGPLAFQYARQDGAWVTGTIPALVPGGLANVLGAGPGPVLYGRTMDPDRGHEVPVLWRFTDGEGSPLELVNLADEVGWRQCDWRDLSIWNPWGSSVEVPLLGLTAPNEAGFSRTVLECDDGAFAIVTPGLGGVDVTVTAPPEGPHGMAGLALPTPDSDLIVPLDTDRPALIGWCSTAGPTLNALQVVYRSDRDPAFGYEVEVPADCRTELTNVATIFTETPQITSSNDTSSVTSALASTDLALRLDADRSVAVFGDTITYAATVVNEGAHVARNVQVSLNLPSGDGVQAGSLVTHTLPTLGPGAEATFTHTVEVTTAEAFIPLPASGTVSTDSIECDATNNTATAMSLTGSLPNVGVTLVAPLTWPAGAPRTWTATVYNDGNAQAHEVTLDLALPPGATILDVIIDDPDENMDCAIVGGSLQCFRESLDALVDGGPTITVSVILAGPPCALLGETVNATATVDALIDIDASDNMATRQTAVTEPTGRLRLSLVPDRSTVEAGEVMTWHLHYGNIGTGAVTDLSAALTLPPGLTPALAGSTPGVALGGGAAAWALPALLPGQGGVLSLRTEVAPGAGPTLGASAQLDVPPGGNACPVAATAEAQVTGPGLHIVKQASRSAACNAEIDWRLTVTNTGSDLLEELVVLDTVPSGSPYVSGSIAGPGASALGAPTLSWAIGALAPGEAVTLGFRSQPPSAGGGLVSNTARVVQGAVTLAESAPAVVWGTCSGSALRVDKAWDGGCVVEADTVSVSVTASNSGGGALSTVRISDPLPAGMTFLSSDTGGTYDAASGVIVQEAASLAAGQQLVLSYTAQVDGAAGSLRLASAVATAEGLHPQVSNAESGVLVSCDDGDACTSGSCELFVGCVQTLEPRPDVADDQCDGIDQNCDGVPDDGWVDEASTCGLGACEGAGWVVCPPGATEPFDTCEPGEPLSEVDDDCDGVDDNCSGVADDDWVDTVSICGLGLCESTGQLLCPPGATEPVDTCEPGAPLSLIDDTCDGVDDNCSGVADDDFVGGEITCGLGVCAREGTVACVGGVLVEDCVPGEPLVEIDTICNGLDDNCDGEVIDEEEAFIGEVIACGSASCAAGTTLTRCEGGQVVGDCDPAWQQISDVGDDVCASPGPEPSGRSVVYLIVQGPDGRDAGSVRCWQEVATGAMACETEAPGSRVLRVFDELLCLGVQGDEP